MEEYERIVELKKFKKLASNFIEQYTPLVNQKNKEWRKDRMLLCIVELKDIIRTINSSLKPEKVKEYCVTVNEALNSDIGLPALNDITNPAWVKKAKFDEQTKYNDAYGTNLLNRLSRLAPEQSLVHDIYWLELGTQHELIEIALGIKSVNELIHYLPRVVEDSKIICERFLSIGKIPELSYEIFMGAIQHSEQKDYIISNILILTLLESATKNLLSFLYSKQNPSLSLNEVNKYIYEDFNSLESLIKKGNWKRDYKININDSIGYYYDFNDPEITELKDKHEIVYKSHQANKKQLLDTAERVYKSIEKARRGEKVDMTSFGQFKEVAIPQIHADSAAIRESQDAFISIKTILGFLNRKYKDDRNQIIHGNYYAYNDGWSNLYYLKAFTKVLDIFESYIKLYEQ